MKMQDYSNILDSLDTVGIYVIREDDHRILYFNKKVKTLIPDARTGVVCSDLWKGSCASCPLIGIGNRDKNQSLNLDGPDHMATDIYASRVLWNDEIPAFVVSFSPHKDSNNATYEKIVKGNLTTNACEAIKMQDRERRMLPKEGFTLSMALSSFARGGVLYAEDVERFNKFSNLENMSRELKNGKEFLMCNYRRNTDRGCRWNTMEVTRDVNYTDENQSVLICVKDVHDYYREGLEYETVHLKNEAVLKALGQENFGIYLIELSTGNMSLVRVAPEDQSFINEEHVKWEEVLHFLLTKRYHPDYAEKVRNALSLSALRAAREAGKEKKELLVERLIGDQWHYVSANAYFHQDSFGRDYAILAFQDVDEHIRSEIDHLHNEKRMAAVIRSGYSRMDFVDLKTGLCERMLLDQKGNERFLKGNYQEYIEQAANSMVFKEDREHFLAAMSLERLRQKAEDAGEYKEEVIQYRFGQKPPFMWLEQHIFYLRQENEVEVNIFGRDITKTKEQEEKDTRRAQEKTQIINSLSGMFFSTGYIDVEKDILRRIVRRDNGMEVLGTRIAYDEGIHKYANVFINSEDQEEYFAHVGIDAIRNRLTPEHPVLACEYREKPDQEGKCRWIRASIVLSEVRDNRPVTALYVAQDITVNKQKEIRDREILQDALETANFANASKSEFLSKMSHDIRTPMNAIIGMTAIAGTHLDDKDRVSDCLAKITVSGRHLLSLINEVLDLSKIESGRLDLSEEEFSLSAFFDELTTMILPTVQTRRQKLECRLYSIEHEKVIGDSLRLQQVFTNILSNAVKYTPPGGKIEVEIHEIPSAISGYGHYEFIFRDNGIGMSEEYAKHIFEPFSREEDSDGTRAEGTGLGMAIARNIVQMMNGDITVKTKKNQGSEFMVSLFLKTGDDQAPDIGELIDLPVLVADDDEISCETACQVLCDLGMKGEWVLSGPEAIEKVETAHQAQRDYFAVILDWKMPGMDGIETARQIRLRVGPEVPIIILSGYDWGEIEEEARAAGVSGFISKPLFKSRLVYLFRQFLEKDDKKKSAGEDLKDIGELDYSEKTILLAEDNELNREIAVEIIGMTGVKIECAVNGKEAVKMFESSPAGYYDLIFMDIQMPLMNGHEATRQIRAMDRPDAETVPIIAMSANAFASDITASKQAGMNEHIIKPLNFKGLTRCLAKWLS